MQLCSWLAGISFSLIQIPLLVGSTPVTILFCHSKMIHYRQDPWLGFCILLQPHGSVLLCAVPRALIAGLLTWALMAYGVNKQEAGGDVMWSPTVFNFFLSLAALVLAFHTNQAYQRFWEARSQVRHPIFFP